MSPFLRGFPRLVLALAVFVVPARVLGADHYACDCGAGADAQCATGDDAKDGSTPATAWKSLSKVAEYWSSTMPAGDRVLLCRGGMFPQTGDRVWQNPRCTVEQPCTLADYVVSGSAAMALPIVTAIHLQGPARGYQLRNLRVANASNRAGDGVWSDGDVDDVTIDALEVDHFSNGVAMNANADRWAIRASTLHDNSTLGALVEGGNVRLEKVRVLRNNLRIHGDSTESTIVDSEFEPTSGDAVEIYGNHSNVLLSRNDVHPSDPTVRLGAATFSGGSIDHVTIRQNRFANAARGVKVVSCVNCLVENNVFLYGNFNSVADAALTVGRASSDVGIVKDVIVRNNSFALGSFNPAAISLYEASGIKVRSNAISLSRADAVCFVTASSLANSDYNVCNRPWSNLESWTTYYETHSTRAEPGFTAASSPSWDLRPAGPTSPLVDHGAPIGEPGSSAVDFFGNARTGVPDVGAYEFGNPGTGDDAGTGTSDDGGSSGTDSDAGAVGPIPPGDAGGQAIASGAPTSEGCSCDLAGLGSERSLDASWLGLAIATRMIRRQRGEAKRRSR
jgi:hypothetical protein